MRPESVTSGTPPPGYEMTLMDQGLDPAEFSSPLVIPYLSAGQHVIGVEKSCYAALAADFQVTLEDTELPLELEPIVLAESRSNPLHRHKRDRKSAGLPCNVRSTRDLRHQA